ncbi:MAG: hypothetical protein AAF184_12810 [Pseudomonadota bacterium]
MSDGKDDKLPKDEDVLAFPHSRSRPPGSTGTFKDLGVSKAAQATGKVQPNLKGHWCSRCKGIWWGYVGECECPACGNRNG